MFATWSIEVAGTDAAGIDLLHLRSALSPPLIPLFSSLLIGFFLSDVFRGEITPHHVQVFGVRVLCPYGGLLLSFNGSFFWTGFSHLVQVSLLLARPLSPKQRFIPCFFFQLGHFRVLGLRLPACYLRC